MDNNKHWKLLTMHSVHLKMNIIISLFWKDQLLFTIIYYDTVTTMASKNLIKVHFIWTNFIVPLVVGILINPSDSNSEVSLNHSVSFLGYIECFSNFLILVRLCPSCPSEA